MTTRQIRDSTIERYRGPRHDAMLNASRQAPEPGPHSACSPGRPVNPCAALRAVVPGTPKPKATLAHCGMCGRESGGLVLVESVEYPCADQGGWGQVLGVSCLLHSGLFFFAEAD